MWHPLSLEDGSVFYNCYWPSPWQSFSGRVPQDSLPHFTVSDSRLPQPGEPDPRIYISQEQVAQLYRQALCSLFITSNDLQAYSGGIRPCLHTCSILWILSLCVECIHNTLDPTKDRTLSVTPKLYCSLLDITCFRNGVSSLVREGFGLECRHLTEHSSGPPPSPSKTGTILSILNIYPIYWGGLKRKNLLYHPKDRGAGHCCITVVNTLLPLTGNGPYIIVHAYACPNVFFGLLPLSCETKIKVGSLNHLALCLALPLLLGNSSVNTFLR
jgi:hypothetical protein